MAVDGNPSPASEDIATGGYDGEETALDTVPASIEVMTCPKIGLSRSS
jgi:hypothetical protein